MVLDNEHHEENTVNCIIRDALFNQEKEDKMSGRKMQESDNCGLELTGVTELSEVLHHVCADGPSGCTCDEPEDWLTASFEKGAEAARTSVPVVWA